jgi:hypothetical protein
VDRREAQGSKWLDASVAGRRHGKRLYVDLVKMKPFFEAVEAIRDKLEIP